jgi:hypothetical protein
VSRATLLSSPCLPFCPNKLSSVAQLFLLPLTIAYSYSTSSQPPGLLRISACPEGDQLSTLRKRELESFCGDRTFSGAEKSSRPNSHNFGCIIGSAQRVAPPRGPVPDLALTAASNTKSLSPPSFVTLHTFPLILIRAKYKPGITLLWPPSFYMKRRVPS